MSSALELLNNLDRDQWRSANSFSADIEIACKVLLNPYARDDERRVAIRGWLAKNQPCVFGQIAARSDQLFISIIDEKLLSRGDEIVKEKLRLDKQTWKQWSLGENGKHGFLLVVLSSKLHFAAPNGAFKRLAEHIRELFAIDSRVDPVGNDMVYEWLYLRNPQTGRFYKFRIILDFFASAADRRWWHDHRFPGGMAFTFNSLGHMARTQEWYARNKDPVQWAARLAMHTIANAHQHPSHGAATSLLQLNNGLPLKPMKCPFINPETVSKTIQGKDWTTYQGFHHTDHSIRAEFFDGRETPDRSRGQYLLDFSYIGGGTEGENRELMDGIIVDKGLVDADIGPVEEWRFARPSTKIPVETSGEEETPIAARDSTWQPERPVEETERIAEALKECKKWLDQEISL